uniref:Serpin peptidase inhibitor, clade C (antithrombin), member 1 n=1 Tax=Hippocampus comes TaxID=109280 RepID=A0A3Q2YFN4_HIPCM
MAAAVTVGMASCHWLFLLSVLSLASGRAPEDPCGIKAKDAALEPRCVYRAPEGEPADREDLEASVPRATDRRVWELSVANARFALSLYRRVALGRTADSNVFLSPLGVSAAFSVTKLGACGRTLEEIMKVFEFDSVTGRTSAQVHFYFAKLLCRLQRTKDASTELAVATRLFGDRSLDAFHKAFLEVNELGSEASASSAAVASGRSIKLDAQVLRADRPFLLLIREKTIDAFLFVGRVARPCRPRAAGPRP